MRLNNSVKYFFEYVFVISLFYFLRFLNIKISSFLCGTILWVFGKLSKKNNIAIKNINLVFPNYSETEKKKIISQMWFNFGRVIGEYPHLHKIKIKKCTFVKLEGHKKCINICEKNKNILFFSAHIGNWELTSHPMTQFGEKIWFIYRAPNNPFVDNLLRRIREKYGVKLIKKGPAGAKTCISILKKNHGNIGMLIDQKMNDGVKTNFFGNKAMTASTIAKFALKYKCPIIPAVCIRKKGVEFTIKYFPVISFEKIKRLGSETKIMNHLNTYVETWIKDNPGQWMWAHNRW